MEIFACAVRHIIAYCKKGCHFVRGKLILKEKPKTLLTVASEQEKENYILNYLSLRYFAIARLRNARIPFL